MACCHCTACQKQSASAFGSSAFYPVEPFLANLPPETKGRLKVYTHPTDAGNVMHCYFCPECGVRLFQISHSRADGGRPLGMEGMVAVKAGVVEGLEWRDVVHIWTRSAVVGIPEGETRYEMGPPKV